MKRAIAPVAALLATLAVPAPAQASVVTEQATHGSVKVYLQTFRCSLYELDLTGSFRVGVRTWTGTAYGSACLSYYQPNSPKITFQGSSADGWFFADCTTTMFLDPAMQGTTTTPALFSCKANANGHGLLPLAFEVTTVPNLTGNDPYLDQTGFFDGL